MRHNAPHHRPHESLHNVGGPIDRPVESGTIRQARIHGELVTAPTSNTPAVEHFHAILVHCVLECADTRCGPHDVFLWNARRLAEAILYALADGLEAGRNTGKQAMPDLASLTKLLVQQRRVHDKLQYDFETLRSCGNVGAHTQHPETSIDATTLKACLSSIVLVVEWFYQESVLKRPMPAEVVAALRDLRANLPKPSRSKRDEQQREQLQAERDKATAEAERLREQLREARRALAAAVEPQATETELDFGHERRRRRLAALGWSVAGLLVGLVGGGLAATWLQEANASAGPGGASATPAAVAAAPEPSRTAEPAPATAPAPAPAPDVGGAEPVAAAESDVQAAAAVADADAPTAAAQPAPAAEPPVVVPTPVPEAATVEPSVAPAEAVQPTCPAGMIEVKDGTLSLQGGPWPRKDPPWPQPRPIPPKTKVPAFCIDEVPVRASTYAEQMRDTPCAPRRGNGVKENAERLAINYVTRACAEAYCATREATLPTIAQWERAMRRKRRPQLVPQVGELASDPFPFAVFGDKPDPTFARNALLYEFGPGQYKAGGPALRWNYDQTARRGVAQVSFRCAKPVEP